MGNLQDYKCPNCGGTLEFNSFEQKLKCPYCDSVFEVDTMNAYDEALNETEENEINWSESGGQQWTEAEESHLHEYVCKSCGGTIITDDTTGATNCPYCGNATVLTGQFSGVLKPDYVVPFQLDKKAAMQKFKEHLSDKPLLPKAFTMASHLEEIKGVYVPFWMYDTLAESKAHFTGTRTRSWSDNVYNYTETSYYSLFRSGTLEFENVPSNGSSKVNKAMMESIEPFDMSKAVKFNTAYLAGYYADRYDIDCYESAKVANERIRNSAAAALEKTTYDYSSVQLDRMHINLDSETVKYCLLPVWLMTTKYDGQTYLFAMNGQTGKFVGDLPVDKGAASKKFTSLAAIITLIVGAVGYFLGIF